MFETPLTVIGAIVTDPQRRRVGDAGGGQVPGGQQFPAAHRRGHLGARQLAVPHRQLLGPVGHRGRRQPGEGRCRDRAGQVYTSEYDDRDGNRRSSVEMRATAVGPDLSRYIAKIEKHGGQLSGDGGRSEAADSADIAECRGRR